MAEHSAAVIVKAPVHQVYTLFTHFNDFPKFMGFVKEVTYYDEQRSHWVVQLFKQYEWDAVNEDWQTDQQIGWRSTRGLRNSGRVKFHPLSANSTSVEVYIHYTPPSGPLGKLGETLGASAYLEAALKKDLEHFAQMVEQAPAGALDPMSSHYLFHTESAIGKGQLTEQQRAAMARDPMMAPEVLAERQARIKREEELRRQAEASRQSALQQRLALERQRQQEQQSILERERVRRLQEQRALAEERRRKESIPPDPRDRERYAAWAHGLGDKDGGRARFPRQPDPMSSRRANKPSVTDPPRSE
ncbi:SRPBCC family protein [Tengunoibacter tsumagoiensis]|uniref:Coenzyme Q-binding protein COQ10 START domain-containing protein n=1 Tax=Tengunoibacter tsumagoiensis TaxID=2014871 RepID=A0A402A3S3_9CHLR|nr:SRPBCC family protein [Tengunoibacter tsumagoiensis]GCE13808.1 hypothetical protein KTT_36670 [Tengunoibacter tsumagoiensis]